MEQYIKQITQDQFDLIEKMSENDINRVVEALKEKHLRFAMYIKSWWVMINYTKLTSK